MPSWVAFLDNSRGTGWWLTKNLSPDGQSVLYFQNPSPDPAEGPYSGKYYVKNLRTGSIQPLFAGSNDNAAPGYGYLARDPADGNTIAFTNSTSEYSVSPACVYLMNADGSNQRILWCAPPTIDLPDYPGWPLLSVESIRWSGNGQKMMVYASYEPPPLGDVPRKPGANTSLRSMFVRSKTAKLAQPSATGPVEGPDYGWSALFVVDVPTGTGVKVAANIVDPPSGDISYDGTKVIYEQYDYAQCGDEDQEALGDSLCVTDLTKGTVTDLFQPTVWSYYGDYQSWWQPYWYPEILLSPDGSRAVFTMQTTTGNEADLYTINTDATNFKQLTSNPNPSTAQTAWTPVAWSADGTRILANRGTVPAAGSNNQTLPGDIHIINASTGNDKVVTTGYAVDWRQQP